MAQCTVGHITNKSFDSGAGVALSMSRPEFEDFVIKQIEAYTGKPADLQDLRNACR